MSRISEKIKIGEYEITLNEFRVRDVRNLISSPQSLNSFQDLLKLLPTISNNLTLEMLDDFTFSEIDQLWEAFTKINKSFFDKLKKTGIMDTLLKAIPMSINEQMQKYLTTQSVDLSNVTTPTP